MIIRRLIQKAITFLVSIPLIIKRNQLKRIYQAQHIKKTNIGGEKEGDNEQSDLSFVHELRKQSLVNNENKYASKSYRFLFHLPSSGVGVVWFKDLIQILQHTGFECISVPLDDPNFKTKWNEFQPNVFISIDFPKIINSLDLEFILKYKQEHGCIRLFTPYPKFHFPKPEMSKEDQWRFELALAGKTADAYFCMYVDEYWSLAHPEWSQAGFEYLPLPHGCNPLYQYPRTGKKKYDYFMATSFGPERLRVTWDYMKPIFEKYQGLWAGPNWGFGLGFLDANQLPQYYAESRIVPNPLASNLINFPMEITDRTFSAMANGAFQITDWTPVTNQFFKEDELVQVHGKEDFLAKFDYYISHENERNKILEKGLRRLYQDHTYFHRIDRLIAFLDKHQTSTHDFSLI